MVKKKKRLKPRQRIFNSDPFSDLKGFAVSSTKESIDKRTDRQEIPQKTAVSFADEMASLGVQPLMPDAAALEATGEATGDVVPEEPNKPGQCQTEEEIFLAAMNSIRVDYEDSFHEPELKAQAIPRRMKQVRQGRLVPDASLDLHGCRRSDVVPKLRSFMQNAQYHDWQTLLVITGKGLHSESGEAVLRLETERFLSGEGASMIAEWGIAPNQFGGQGALVLFLKKKS